jgi:DNA helicase-2/ATP-dependent DNA helicase PcrA
MDKNDSRADYVTLMTIHTSKWLEQKRVFLTGLEEWIFPSFRSINDTHALEEERRLMYVAMTRAREELYISRAKERFHFWDYVRNPESRFMKEIPKDHIEMYDMSEFTNSWNWSIFNSSSLTWNSEWFSFWNNTWWFSTTPKIKTQANNDISQFSRGDKVTHPKFGWWIITSLNWELAEIAFSGKWTKKMNIKIAPVRKV